MGQMEQQGHKVQQELQEQLAQKETNGADGAIGAQGPAGATGATGAQGDTGAAGALMVQRMELAGTNWSKRRYRSNRGTRTSRN